MFVGQRDLLQVADCLQVVAEQEETRFAESSDFIPARICHLERERERERERG